MLSQNLYMSLLIKDVELLKTYKNIWDKVRDSIKHWLDGEPVHNNKYITAKKISCVVR